MKRRSTFASLRLPLVVLGLLLAACVQQSAPEADDLRASDSHEVTINEIRIDQPDSDDDEYFELHGAAGTSLDGLAYLVIGDDPGGTAGSGVIEEVVELSDGAIPTSGFFVVGQGTFSLGTEDLTTELNFENRDNVTHLLVRDFTGALDQDLDTDDDGTLDSTPWSSVLDAVSLVETPGGGDRVYAPALGGSEVGPDGEFVPAHAFRCGSGWRIGAFDPASGDDTPGAANACPVADLVINEIMQNPSAVSDSDGEWFELYNPGGSAVDIDGWILEDNDFDAHVIANGGPLEVPAGGYLVLGTNADSATNGGVGVAYEYSGVFLGNGADELVLKRPDGSEVDRVEWDGGPGFPDPNGASMALRDPGLDNNAGANWCTASTPYGDGDLGTPGAANDCDATPPVGEIGSCGDPATLIHEVQGSGDVSPLAGQIVVIEGVVVGDFQGIDSDPFDTDLGGFFVQEEAADQDGDPATSEGVFVFAPGATDVQIGDLVRVKGTASEFSDQTQVTADELLVCGTATPPAPTEVLLPSTDAGLERFEGMLVVFPQELVISEYFNFDRFGEITLALPNPDFEDRQFQPTAFVDPGTAAEAEALENELGRIVLDDARTTQNPDPARHPNGEAFDLDNRFRGGDLVQNVTGVLSEAFGAYRIQPTEGADYTPTNPRPAAPEDVGGELTVAAFNVLNYFTTLDDSGPICGPSGDQGCRGADNATEFQRQQAKIVAALAAIDADVVGLIEIENNDTAVHDLVAALNAVMGAGTYAAIDTGSIGTDAIKVAFIYQPASVTPVGNYAVLDTSEFVAPNTPGDPKNRPALAQTFEQTSDGAVFTAVVNHFKSKGSGCGAGDDDPQQGNCNLTRTLAAEALADWLATDPTGSGDPDVLIVGDLNAYDEEEPIDALVAAGYTDLLEAYEGEFAYTFVFDGQFGYLDYALANQTLREQVTGATAWHINADEPDILDYDTSFKQDAQDALYEPNAYRSSDHDPVIVGLDLNAAPLCDVATPSLASIWPPNHKMVEIRVQGVTDPEGDLVSIVIDGIFQDEPVDAPGDADGSSAPDGSGVGGSSAMVRAERAEDGNGRVYHIAFTASDPLGASCSGEVLVGVPTSQGRRAGPAVDDGALYDSTVTP